MIDQQLITDNTQTLIASLNNATPVNQQLSLIQSAFTPALLAKLEQYFVDNETSELWMPDTSYNVPRSDRPRHKITWDSDTVIEELHDICNNATDSVKSIYNADVKPFCGIAVWRDREGFSSTWHVDNPMIDVSMQVYLQGPESNPGTEFEVGSGTVVAKFIPNTGYIVRHTGTTRPLHRITHPVPAGAVRYSLFAIWGDRQ